MESREEKFIDEPEYPVDFVTFRQLVEEVTGASFDIIFKNFNESGVEHE